MMKPISLPHNNKNTLHQELESLTPREVCPNVNPVVQHSRQQRLTVSVEIFHTIMILQCLLKRFRALVFDRKPVLSDVNGELVALPQVVDKIAETIWIGLQPSAFRLSAELRAIRTDECVVGVPLELVRSAGLCKSTH